ILGADGVPLVGDRSQLRHAQATRPDPNRLGSEASACAGHQLEGTMISAETRQPVRAPSAWRPAHLPTSDACAFMLTPARLAACDGALAASAGRRPEDLTAGDFPLGGIAADVAAWRDDVLRGRGFVVLRELPRDRYSDDDLGKLFFGLGTHFGRPVSQSSM